MNWSVRRKLLLLLISACVASAGQTRIRIQDQSRAADLSGHAITKPMRVGSELPATCSPGEFFFLSGAEPGKNTYACTSPGQWTLQQGGSDNGPSLAAGQGDPLAVQRIDNTRLAINAGCSPSRPCNVRFGAETFQFTSSSTVTVTSSASGTVWIYVGKGGNLYAGHNLPEDNVQCNGCVAVPGLAGFPADAVPGYAWPVHAGALAEPQASFDQRAFLSTKTVAAGLGMVRVEAAGETILGINRGIVSVFSTGSGSPPEVCEPGETYIQLTGNRAWQCTGSNQWTETTGGGGGSVPTKVRLSAWLPTAANGASASGVTAGGWYSPGTNGAANDSGIGTSPWRFNFLRFQDGASTITTNTAWVIPSNWDGASITLRLKWTHDSLVEPNPVYIRWVVSTACVSDGEVFDPTGSGPAFSAPQAVESQVGVYSGGRQFTTVYDNVAVAGCAAGDTLLLRVQREAGHANDTFTGAALLFGAQIEYGVLLQ